MIFVYKGREGRQKKFEETHHWSRMRTLDKFQNSMRRKTDCKESLTLEKKTWVQDIQWTLRDGHKKTEGKTAVKSKFQQMGVVQFKAVFRFHKKQ